VGPILWLRDRGLSFITAIGLAVLLCIRSGGQVLAEPPDHAPPPNHALVLLAPGTDINLAIQAVKLAGGRVIHAFPSAAASGQAALIAELPAGIRPPEGTLAIHRQRIDDETLANLTGEARRAAQVWNALLDPPSPAATRESLDTLAAELVGDAFIPPPSVYSKYLADDPTPGYTETSEYFIGRVAVGIILPESDGSVDPSTEDWTEDERTLVLSEITAALNWWATLEPKAHLSFVYDDGTAAPIATGYEPISRSHSDHALWIADVMERKGYTASSYFDQVRHYNNDLRDTYKTDWAFTIFVVDSSNDSDNRFSDDYFAYAYLGGPFTVMTYGNDGYGPENMDAVAAHEIGHIFLALDQYYSAYQPCTRLSGYLGIENQNSQYGECASDEPSIMRGQTQPYRDGAIDQYARGQVGWHDSDGDGILDPVDTVLSVVGFEYTVDEERPNVLTFAGMAQDDPHPSPLRRSTIINKIERVQVRVADGEWIDAEATDGAFDTYAEGFTLTTPPLPTGEWAIDLRITDSAGNELIQTVATIPVVDPVDEILDTTLVRLGQQAVNQEETQLAYNGRGTSATSYIAGAYYRIDDGPWQPLVADDGAFDEPQEDFTFIVDLTNLQPGTHTVQAYSTDGEGNTETSPASDTISVRSQTRYVLLPLVLANQ